jgi:hypothetical protein
MVCGIRVRVELNRWSQNPIYSFYHDYPVGSANYVLLDAYKIGDTIYSYHRAANTQS